MNRYCYSIQYHSQLNVANQTSTQILSSKMTDNLNTQPSTIQLDWHFFFYFKNFLRTSDQSLYYFYFCQLRKQLLILYLVKAIQFLFYLLANLGSFLLHQVFLFFYSKISLNFYLSTQAKYTLYALRNVLKNMIDKYGLTLLS